MGNLKTAIGLPDTSGNWLISTEVNGVVVETKVKDIQCSNRHYLVKMRSHLNKVVRELEGR